MLRSGHYVTLIAMRDREPQLRLLPTSELTDAERADLRSMLDAAFDDGDPDEGFGDHDWQHALGGIHAVVSDRGVIVSHASVVPRELRVAGRPLRCGYVEAVATRPGHQGRGFGTIAMQAIDDVIRRDYELGALGTGAYHFYERLGWERWHGATSVRTAGVEHPTPDADGAVLILRTARTPADLDLAAPLSCDWRPGDVW